MPESILIYGDIAGPEARRMIEATYPDRASRLMWQNERTSPDATRPASVIFVDLDDPDFSSPEFLMGISESSATVSIVGKSCNPCADDASRYSKFGVSEILTPDQCLSRLSDCLTDAGEHTQPGPARDQRFGYDALIGSSPQVGEIKSTLRVLAEVDFPSALFLGETGTGKSLLCKVMHNTGVRYTKNMVEVNCSAIPDELFESELFGHVKGAFTDAKTDKMGLFEYAQSGTVFLDEVGNLSTSAQAKLLKVLEDRVLRKVGALAETEINVRVVAATNLNLTKAIEDGAFREDLYHRLNLLVVEIPPLRERPEDIPPLLDHYVRRYSELYHKPVIGIGETAISDLMQYSWPGNVRELCNVVERLVLLSRGQVVKSPDIRAALKRGRISLADRRQITIDIPTQGITLQAIEENVVKQVLNMCEWNKSKAARFLGVSRPRLRRIIENAGLEQNRRTR